MIIVWLTFGGVLATILAAYWVLVLVPEQRARGLLTRRLKAEDPVRRQRAIPLLKQPELLSSIHFLNLALSRSGYFGTRLKDAIEQSALPITVGQFLMLSGSLALAACLGIYIYLEMWSLSLIGLVVAAWLPFFVIKKLAAIRVRRFEEQFPEAIDLIARAMRAGHAFATGVKMAADELPPPAGIEFKKLYERQNYGAQLPESLKLFADRIPSLDARFFVTAVLTQREAGGNLSEVLDRLAAVMRERFRIRRDVRVRSAHGRITAYVLAGMPPVLAAFLMSTNPEQFKLLTTDPLGIRMLEAGVVLQLVGILVVRKLVAIEY